MVQIMKLLYVIFIKYLLLRKLGELIPIQLPELRKSSIIIGKTAVDRPTKKRNPDVAKFLHQKIEGTEMGLKKWI